MRVRHTETGAAGRATAHAEALYAGDRQGPWKHVAFDDGLRAWVPDRLLEPLPGPPTLAVWQLVEELRKHDQDLFVTVATDSWWLNVSGVVRPGGEGPSVVIETTDDFHTEQW